VVCKLIEQTSKGLYEKLSSAGAKPGFFEGGFQKQHWITRAGIWGHSPQPLRKFNS